MASETTGGVTKTYAWDYFDRLTSVTEGQTKLQSMTYGPDGKRLSVTDSSGTRKFVYDGNDVIQEYSSDWSTVQQEYTHGSWVDEPLSMTDSGGTTHYLMKDRLGSIINILDSNETLKTTYSYDAFGEPTATYHSGQIDCMCPRHSGSGSQLFAYSSASHVTERGLHRPKRRSAAPRPKVRERRLSAFYRARYYNQSLGRFFSRDPLFS